MKRDRAVLLDAHDEIGKFRKIRAGSTTASRDDAVGKLLLPRATGFNSAKVEGGLMSREELEQTGREIIQTLRMLVVYPSRGLGEDWEDPFELA